MFGCVFFKRAVRKYDEHEGVQLVNLLLIIVEIMKCEKKRGV